MTADENESTGDDEDSPHERGDASAKPGSGRLRLEAPAAAVAEFPSELRGERASKRA